MITPVFDVIMHRLGDAIMAFAFKSVYVRRVFALKIQDIHQSIAP
tara:strand:- start:2117 stop:2251 length:135 start_codon:yes stop_codon:yes gene_type:complete